jgi:hypothetical protein
MAKVFKYSLGSPSNRVVTHEGAEFLSAGMQNGAMQVWALVDPEAPAETYQIDVYGTGWELPPMTAARHVATVMAGDLVWHVFNHGPRRGDAS